ncbi:ABC transporter permease [Clostridium sp. CM028]|uniref:ABC transporter permease n=1 Tax=Clostridium sp. CM028 TaxID=2851575 RepID=UPI001C6E5AC2|nr:ABC transporter permease [Clostridium sp. CM028]MBW9148786.1 ABC transporter permease [Clostridium sp. CM028]WLC63110.1 ABC transporter permease [Clostridium sp. CM028]
MLNLLKVEFYKLKTSKTFKLILVLMVVQSILCPITFSKEMTGKQVLLQVFGAQEFIALYMLIGAFAACYIGDEFSTGCIKNLIACGHKRRDIVIAKSISYYVGIAIISLTSPILITIINTIMNGYGEVFTLNSLAFILELSFLMVLIYIGIGSIAVLISFIARNSIITVGAFILVDTVNRVCRGLIFRKYLIIKILNKTIFGQSLFLDTDYVEFSQGFKIIGISITTIVVSTLLSVYFFNKAEIK